MKGYWVEARRWRKAVGTWILGIQVGRAHSAKASAGASRVWILRQHDGRLEYGTK